MSFASLFVDGTTFEFLDEWTISMHLHLSLLLLLQLGFETWKKCLIINFWFECGFVLTLGLCTRIHFLLV